MLNRLLALAVFACVAITSAHAANAPQGPAEDVPELKVLNHWVGAGKWDVEMTVKPNAGLPEGMQAKGQSSVKWTLNGRFIQQDTTLRSGGGTPPMKVTGLMTYDPRKQVYRTWMFFSGGAVSETEGKWDEASRTMTSTGQDPQSGGTTTVKATFAPDGSQTWTFIEKDRDGKVISESSGKNTERKQ